MQWQIWWPDWWKLWPYRNKIVGIYDHEGEPMVYLNFLCIGPLQMRWYS